MQLSVAVVFLQIALLCGENDALHAQLLAAEQSKAEAIHAAETRITGFRREARNLFFCA